MPWRKKYIISLAKTRKVQWIFGYGWKPSIRYKHAKIFEFDK